MKELLFALKILELISVLGIANKIVVKSINPQTYTSYCTYSEERTNNSSLAGSRHIITCGDLDCKHYRKLINNAGKVAAGASATVASGTAVIGVGATAAEAAIPIVGGLTMGNLALAACVTLPIVGATIAVIGAGVYLTSKGAEDTVQEVEDDLKLLWEREQLRKKNEQNIERIRGLKRELKRFKQKLVETNQKNNNLEREVEESKEKIRKLKKELCEAEECNCGGNCY
jgi:hypothetical protein